MAARRGTLARGRLRTEPFIARRRLASPDEGLAALLARGASAGDEIVTRRWSDVRIFRARLQGQGSVSIAPSAFYSVAAFCGIAPHVHGDRPSSSGATAANDLGTTLLHGIGVGLRYDWTAPHRVDWVCLEPQLVARIAEQCGIGRAELHEFRGSIQQHDAASESLVGALVEETERESHAAQALIVESIASALACRLVTRLGENLLAPVAPIGALGIRSFRLVREYISAHLGARLSLDELAQVAGVSRFHFARQFRLRTQETPMGYVTRVRIEHAKAALRDPCAKIADVAAALGFADQSHFTRTFKRLTGVSPSVFGRESQRTRVVSGEIVSGARASKSHPEPSILLADRRAQSRRVTQAEIEYVHHHDP